MRRVSSDGVQVGEVQRVQTQPVAQAAREFLREGSRLPNAAERLILISVAAHSVNGPAFLQVDDRHNSEWHSRDDPRTIVDDSGS